MKTLMFQEIVGQVVTVKDVFIFDCDMTEACKKAFENRIFHWAKSPDDIEEEILEGGIVCHEIEDYKLIG